MSTDGLADPILRFFSYAHRPKAMQEISRPFCETAEWMVGALPRNAERSAGLRKLLEAKDCAVRASLEPMPAKPAPRPPVIPPDPV